MGASKEFKRRPASADWKQKLKNYKAKPDCKLRKENSMIETNHFCREALLFKYIRSGGCIFLLCGFKEAANGRNSHRNPVK